METVKLIANPDILAQLDADGDGDVEWDEALPIFQAQGPTRLIKKSCFYGRNPPISDLEVHRKMMKHVPSAAPKLNLFELNYFLQTPF